MIAQPSLLPGVVPPSRSLLLTIDRQHVGVHIRGEHPPGSSLPPGALLKEHSHKPLVHPHKAALSPDPLLVEHLFAWGKQLKQLHRGCPSRETAPSLPAPPPAHPPDLPTVIDPANPSAQRIARCEHTRSVAVNLRCLLDKTKCVFTNLRIPNHLAKRVKSLSPARVV